MSDSATSLKLNSGTRPRTPQPKGAIPAATPAEIVRQAVAEQVKSSTQGRKRGPRPKKNVVVRQAGPSLWMEGRRLDSKTSSTIQLLDEEVQLFYNYARSIPTEHATRLKVYHAFEKIPQQIWSGITCELFGSMATGLYLPHGDFDVVLSHPELDPSSSTGNLRKLEKALRATNFVEQRSLIIIKAKVTILKFVTSPQFGSFKFDISFSGTGSSGPLGAQESIRLLGALEVAKKGDAERAKRLIFFLKAFLEANNAHDVSIGGLGGLSAFAMAVSFVQLDRRPASEQTPGKDLVAFLKYYGSDFDVEKNAISLHDGIVLRSSRPHLTPKNAVASKLLSIQHPVTVERDLSSAGNRFPKIRAELVKAHTSLSTYLSSPPSADSALKPLNIGLTQAVVDQRRRNEGLAGRSLEVKSRSWAPSYAPPSSRGALHPSSRPQPPSHSHNAFTAPAPPLNARKIAAAALPTSHYTSSASPQPPPDTHTRSNASHPRVSHTQQQQKRPFVPPPPHQQQQQPQQQPFLVPPHPHQHLSHLPFHPAHRSPPSRPSQPSNPRPSPHPHAPSFSPHSQSHPKSPSNTSASLPASASTQASKPLKGRKKVKQAMPEAVERRKQGGEVKSGVSLL